MGKFDESIGDLGEDRRSLLIDHVLNTQLICTMLQLINQTLPDCADSMNLTENNWKCGRIEITGNK